MEYRGEEFNDPILRCEQCSKITHRAFITKHGGCFHCGNRRLKNVLALSAEEHKGLKNGSLKIGIDQPYEIDPDFFALFNEAEGVNV